MALFKDDKDDDNKNSMSDFLFSKCSDPKITNKSSTLMFGGEYRNKNSFDESTQKKEHKKIPMFGDNSNINTTNKTNSVKHTFDYSKIDNKHYSVVNNDHQKILMDLRSVVDNYKDIISEEDIKKICFLIEQLKNEL